MRCNQTYLTRFLAGQLNGNPKLEFLFHLDECQACWQRVYQASKSAS